MRIDAVPWRTIPELPCPGSKIKSIPWTAAASLASTSSGTVGSMVGAGVVTPEGAGDGDCVGAGEGTGEGDVVGCEVGDGDRAGTGDDEGVGVGDGDEACVGSNVGAGEPGEVCETATAERCVRSRVTWLGSPTRTPNSTQGTACTPSPRQRTASKNIMKMWFRRVHTC